MSPASSSGAVGRTILSPGVYLTKRREAAGLSLGEVARQLAAMQFGIVHLDRANVLAQLEKVEATEAGLTLPQAQVMRHIFPFDVGIYDQLLDHHLAAKEEREALPLPQICRTCACSFFDPCESTEAEQGGAFTAACHWAEPDLCSDCADKPARPALDARPGTVGCVARDVGTIPVTPIMEGAS